MIIGQRLRSLREAKGLSQGDIENKTGMLRCYISRVENGHTVPSLETVERFAAALDVAVYELFYDNGNGSGAAQSSFEAPNQDPGQAGVRHTEDEKFLRKLHGLTASLQERDRQLLLTLAGRMAMAGQS